LILFLKVDFRVLILLLAIRLFHGGKYLSMMLVFFGILICWTCFQGAAFEAKFYLFCNISG